MTDVYRRIAGFEWLNPKAIESFDALAKALARAYETGETETLFKPFESYRMPERQLDLFAKGTTKARPWRSAHQYGLAVDFVPFVPLSANRAVGEWSWRANHDYKFLAASARHCGLDVPISWDPCHVEHPIWKKLRLIV